MMTRKLVTHQYGNPGLTDYSAPPFHVTMPESQYPAYAGQVGRPPGGGLAGGAVPLNGAVLSRISRTRSGYGYLGMDPSDPTTWKRPFNPAPGMISYLNYQGPVTL